MRAAWRKLLPVMACCCVAAAVMMPMRAAALQMIDHWGGPQARLDRVLDEAAVNLFVMGTHACEGGRATRIYENRQARFDLLLRQARALLGRDPRLSAVNGSCAPYDGPRFVRSVAQFDHYLERATRMIRMRETG